MHTSPSLLFVTHGGNRCSSANNDRPGPFAQGFLQSLADATCSTGVVNHGSRLKTAQQCLSCALVRGRGSESEMFKTRTRTDEHHHPNRPHCLVAKSLRAATERVRSLPLRQNASAASNRQPTGGHCLCSDCLQFSYCGGGTRSHALVCKIQRDAVAGHA